MSGKKKKKPAAKNRDKIDRRRKQRAARQLANERERLARLEPGGAPERPLTVVSAAVVEEHARRLGCAQCTGPLTVDDHAVAKHDGELLRKVSTRCRMCRSERVVWLRITPRLPN